jgi:FlaA1/EpsC-like NDP-sugar epimerase
MIALSGRDIPIVFTALRPGEKREESLVAADESLAEPASPSLTRIESPVAAGLPTHLEALESAVAARDRAEMLRLVQSLVPDYEPSALLRESVAESLAVRS